MLAGLGADTRRTGIGPTMYNLHTWVAYHPGNPQRKSTGREMPYRSSQHRHGSVRSRSNPISLPASPPARLTARRTHPLLPFPPAAVHQATDRNAADQPARPSFDGPGHSCAPPVSLSCPAERRAAAAAPHLPTCKANTVLTCREDNEQMLPGTTARVSCVLSAARMRG